MVCGRLPFGDDSQVKKMQSQNRQINFSRNLTFGQFLSMNNLLAIRMVKWLISRVRQKIVGDSILPQMMQ